jgi:gliding motility-associated-like protein
LKNGQYLNLMCLNDQGFNRKDAKTQRKLSFSFCFFLLYFCLTIISFSGFGEGTKQLLPDSTVSAAGLYFDHSNGFYYPNFGIINCPPNYRLNIHIKNVGETIMFGLKAQYPNIQFNLRKPNGTIALSGTCPSSYGQTGSIYFYHQAITGPFPLIGGYSPFSYQIINIADTGNYYFELSNLSFGSDLIIDYWDFQVVTGQHSPAIPADMINGRVWSQSWQVYADLGNPVFEPFNGKFYVYSDDGIVTKLAFSNAHVGAVTIFCNPYGCLNTGNFNTDRQSKNTNTYIAFPGIAQYKVFLNDPDSTVYPSGVYGQITGTPYMMPDPGFPPCNPEKLIVVNVDKAGRVEVIISFPYGGSSANVSLYSLVSPGVNFISWDGLDGLGNQPPDDTIITVTVNYVNGLTNLPIWDQERNPDGYLISLIRPVNQTNPVPLTYWDDSQLQPNNSGNPCNNPPQTTNLTGCTPGSIPGFTGCHPWNLNLPDCHDKMINTWWYGSTSSAIFDTSFTGIPSDPEGHGAFRCGAGTVTLHATVLPTQTVDWYATPAGGIPLLAGDTTFVTPIINTSTTYYAEARNVTTNCLSASRTPVTATILPVPVPTITGPDSVCTGTSDNVYSTEPGMTGYTWNVSAGGAITSGTGTDVITVIWNLTGLQMVSVTYTDATGCPAVSPSVYDVTVNPLPIPSIAGPVSVCLGSAGNTYTTESGMTGYEWTVSPGGTITGGSGTNAVTVTWYATGTQSVSVSYTDTNGCTALFPTVFEIVVYPVQVPGISGLDTACSGSTGNIYTTEPGMTGYAWTVSSGGIITSGSGTNEITVTWLAAGAQAITVSYTDTNGCSSVTPSVFHVTVDPLPGQAGMINGVSPVCAGTDGVAFSIAPVPDALAYSWALSPGATIASGGGTNSITVDFAADAVSGNFTVFASNSCGNGLPSPPFPVIVNRSPKVAAGDDLWTCESAPVTLSGSDAENYISLAWTTSGNGTFNDNSILHPEYIPGSEDILSGTVTLMLTATVAEPCSADTDYLTLTIARQATVNAGEDNNLCEGLQYILDDARALNYSSLAWSTSGTGSFSDLHNVNPEYFPGEEDILNGKVLLILTAISAPPCLPASDTMILYIFKAPSVHTEPGGAICEEEPFTVSGAVIKNYSSLLWTHDGSGNLTAANTPSPTYIPAEGEAGTVTLTLTAYGNSACSDTFATGKVEIKIYEPPLADAGTDQYVEPGKSALLTGDAEGGSGAYSFIWEPSALVLDATAEKTQTVVILQDTTFIFTVVDLVSGCRAHDSIRVGLSSVPNPPEEDCIIIPNAITPNGDGLNDTWIIDCIENFPGNKVVIFNRWGDQVNEFENYDNTSRVWKGTNAKGVKVPDGTYYYVLTLKSGNTRTGWIFVRGGS